MVFYSWYLSVDNGCLFQKMSESELRPWQQGLPRPLNFWAMFFATMLPTLALVKRILSCVIHARGSEVSLFPLTCVCR